MRRVVVFPAPFGPRKPYTEPSGTSASGHRARPSPAEGLAHGRRARRPGRRAAAPSGPRAPPAKSASTTADVSARGAASGGGTAEPEERGLRRRRRPLAPDREIHGSTLLAAAADKKGRPGDLAPAVDLRRGPPVQVDAGPCQQRQLHHGQGHEQRDERRRRLCRGDEQCGLRHASPPRGPGPAGPAVEHPTSVLSSAHDGRSLPAASRVPHHRHGPPQGPPRRAPRLRRRG